MKRAAAVVLATLLLWSGGQTARATSPGDIKLILLVVVDQFRYDYLTRFRSEYTAGFQQLLTGGAVFRDANLEHYPTVTAVGHATMMTGATPSVSGIIGNDWFDRASAKSVTSVSDPTVKLVGSTTAGGSSPRRLLVSGIGDELKMASPAPKGSPEAPRVIGLSLKDRSAILPVGRDADAACWWDTKSGNFVTSTYYASEAPAWLRAFNEKKKADAWAGQAWRLLAPPAALIKQLPAAPGGPLYDAVYASPYGNDLLLDFATDVIGQERLGQRGVTDLLSVSFSSNDSVGHTFGPDSPQVRDIAARTDRVIGRLLERVNSAVGLSRTLVILTADHGVAPTPDVAKEHRLPGGRMTAAELFGPIEQALTTRYGAGKWVLATAGSSPYLNYELMAQLHLDPAEVRRVAAAAAVAVPHVARVYTRDQLLRGEVPADRIGARVLRSFNAERSGDMEIILEPFWMRQAEGTTHGTPYNYDAQIPLILMGPGVRAGEYADHVALNDLAPTVATMVGVEIPAGSSGRVLTEALHAPAERRESDR